MKFIADFHVHSKYSMATAKNLDLEHLYISAKSKGITVVGTGDFTHPVWSKEIREKLVEAEDGLFSLKNEIKEECDRSVPKSCTGEVRFILTSEISNIYKKNGRTRKNHNLIFAENFESLEKINNKLNRIGNIKSDGRPILGLDAKDLLEIILNVDDKNFLIPAHIWTPWFSLFGSKSGFDSIEECFEDLTPYIFALETGLSSDPPMNRRISKLDKYTLVSNSDAHSPSKLGREANLFDTKLSYSAIKSAMQKGDKDKFLGTFEFFPEEGKYHLDGHRKCGLSFYPEETRKYNGICPKCGKSLTIGVLYRVEELSDMPIKRNIDNFHPFFSIIPLTDILSDILKVGAGSKKVLSAYMKTIETLGDEFSILHSMSEKDLSKAPVPLLKEAVLKIRENKVTLIPGFDGEFGKIKIFDEKERENLLFQTKLFSLPASKKKPKKPDREKVKKTILKKRKIKLKKAPKRIKFNDEQKKAIETIDKTLLIIAGPGTGKTGTIAARISFLIKEKKISSKNILAITFTNKAADEMKNRIKMLAHRNLCHVSTFHSLCFNILKNSSDYKQFKIIDENDRLIVFKDAVKKTAGKGYNVNSIFNAVISAKQLLLNYDDDLKKICPEDLNIDILIKCYKKYQDMLKELCMYDFEDIIFNCAHLFEKNENIRKKYQNLFKYIFIDEYQDINYGQYQIIKALYGSDTNICAIGDPDQSIYGFRGSNISFFYTFQKDFENLKVVSLRQNYRSTKTILKASNQVIAYSNRFDIIKSDFIKKEETFSEIEGEKSIKVIKAHSANEEIRKIADIIEKEIGGYGYFAIDSGKIDSGVSQKAKSFSDFAVLFRTKAFAKNISYIFEKAGIPYQIAMRENIFLKTGIKEILSFLKIIEGVETYIDVERIKGFLNVKLEKKLAEHKTSMKNLSVSEKIDYIIQNSKAEKLIGDDEEKLTALKKVRQIANESGNDAGIFFDKIAFFKDTDSYDERAEKVSLMTMHAAKGLEFPIVFISGFEEGFIPFDEEKIEDMEEERRLFFVAMTRAKEELYLSFSKKRTIYGKSMERKFSRFAKSIDENFLEELDFSYNNRKKCIQKRLF
jgi:DNA helicase II / ATP-dependent DNA helicase PcrA